MVIFVPAGGILSGDKKFRTPHKPPHKHEGIIKGETDKQRKVANTSSQMDTGQIERMMLGSTNNLDLTPSPLPSHYLPFYFPSYTS